MNEKLQQAVAATRAGRKQEAQLLLTQVLKDTPENAQAWYLLSHLVDSEQKQIAYLGKVVALDPGHEKARQRLARLRAATETPAPKPEVAPSPPQPEIVITPASETETTSPPPKPEPEDVMAEAEVEPSPEPPPLSTEPLDFIAQETGATVPAWMAGDAAHLNLNQVAIPEKAEDTSAMTVAQSDIPDWLQETVGEEWSETGELAEEELFPIGEEPLPEGAIVGVESAIKPQAQPEPAAQLTRILVGLVAAAVIVTILLVYTIATAFQ